MRGLLQSLRLLSQVLGVFANPILDTETLADPVQGSKLTVRAGSRAAGLDQGNSAMKENFEVLSFTNHCLTLLASLSAWSGTGLSSGV